MNETKAQKLMQMFKENRSNADNSRPWPSFLTFHKIKDKNNQSIRNNRKIRIVQI